MIVAGRSRAHQPRPRSARIVQESPPSRRYANRARVRLDGLVLVDLLLIESDDLCSKTSPTAKSSVRERCLPRFGNGAIEAWHLRSWAIHHGFTTTVRSARSDEAISILVTRPDSEHERLQLRGHDAREGGSLKVTSLPSVRRFLLAAAERSVADGGDSRTRQAGAPPLRTTDLAPGIQYQRLPVDIIDRMKSSTLPSGDWA